jgi:hypothetical protein
MGYPKREIFNKNKMKKEFQDKKQGVIKRMDNN